MKIFSITGIILFSAIFNYGSCNDISRQLSDVEDRPAQEISVAEQENPVQELTIKELEFENLPKESQIGDLAELVQQKSNSEETLSYGKTHLILFPYDEMIAYVNGWLCHIGYYTQSIIYTVLEGPYYGTQTTTTYDGAILYVNYDYKVKYAPGVVNLTHHYSDSKINTGSNSMQFIKFK